MFLLNKISFLEKYMVIFIFANTQRNNRMKDLSWINKLKKQQPNVCVYIKNEEYSDRKVLIAHLKDTLLI